MNISELSKLSGLNAPTIRYYEQIKLLPKPQRLGNGYRKYSANDLQQLLLIKQAQQVGFSLEEIRALVPSNMMSWQHDTIISALEGKVKDINRMQKALTENKKNILKLIDFIKNKPEDITCGENAQRLMDIYLTEPEKV